MNPRVAPKSPVLRVAILTLKVSAVSPSLVTHTVRELPSLTTRGPGGREKRTGGNVGRTEQDNSSGN